MKIQTLLVIVVRCFLLTATEDDVQIPPLITESPRAYAIYLPGSLVTIECKAEGSPDVRYTWTKNGVELKDHIKYRESRILLIHNATAYDEGIYQCAASNAYGRDISDKSRVQMVYFKKPAEFGQQEQKRVTEGKPFTLSASQIESFPKAQIRWLAFHWQSPGKKSRNAIIISRGSMRHLIDKNGGLHVAYAIPEDSSVSYMPVTLIRVNDKEPYSYVGNETILAVSRADGERVAEAPQLLFADGPDIALIGRNASFRCLYSGYPHPAITWTLPGGSRLSSRHEVNFNGTEFFINYIESSDEGKYTCSAVNSVEKLGQDLYIRVEAVPTFNKNSDRPHNIDAIEGGTVTFVCNAADAQPKASIDWFYNGELIYDDSIPKRFEISDSRKRLTIKFVRRVCKDRETRTDLMVIQCNASNVHGYAFASGYLNIVEPPACEGATWITLISSTLIGSLLMLVVGLIVGLRCKELSKYRAVSARDQHEYYRTRATMESFYETIRDEGGINQHRLSRPMTANTSFTERQTSRPLVGIPGSTQPQRSGEEEHEYYPKEDVRRPSITGSDDRAPMKAPHYLTISD